MKDKTEQAKRINTALTYKIEKSVLIYLAQRVPQFITPDILTTIGLVSAFLIGLCFFLSSFNPFWLLGSIFLLVIHWLADSLDGTVARVRNIERERFGYFVDHISDMFAIIFVMIGLGLSPLVNIIFALSFIIVYFLASINTYLSAYTHGIFKLSLVKIGPTEIRLLMIILTIIILVFGYPLTFFEINNISVTLFDLIIIILVPSLFFMTVISVIKNLIFLNKIDQKKFKEMTPIEYFRKIQFIRRFKESDFLKSLLEFKEDIKNGKYFK